MAGRATRTLSHSNAPCPGPASRQKANKVLVTFSCRRKYPEAHTDMPHCYVRGDSWLVPSSWSQHGSPAF